VVSITVVASTTKSSDDDVHSVHAFTDFNGSLLIDPSIGLKLFAMLWVKMDF
jgi:hypothetical protein